jgi:hypothetical protein
MALSVKLNDAANKSCLPNIRVIRPGYEHGDHESQWRVLFDLPDGSRADLYVTVKHGFFFNKHHFSEWQNQTFGKIDEKPAHADEVFGLLSGCNDPDIGIEKFDAMLSPFLVDDFADFEDANPAKETAESWREHNDELERDEMALGGDE